MAPIFALDEEVRPFSHSLPNLFALDWFHYLWPLFGPVPRSCCADLHAPISYFYWISRFRTPGASVRRAVGFPAKISLFMVHLDQKMIGFPVNTNSSLVALPTHFKTEVFVVK